MPLPVWIALAVLVIATVAGAIHLFLRGRTFLRTFKSFGGEMDRTTERLTLALEQLEHNSQELGSSTPKLEASIARLRVSTIISAT